MNRSAPVTGHKRLFLSRGGVAEHYVSPSETGVLFLVEEGTPRFGNGGGGEGTRVSETPTAPLKRSSVMVAAAQWKVLGLIVGGDRTNDGGAGLLGRGGDKGENVFVPSWESRLLVM